jgi:hypothetical protein
MAQNKQHNIALARYFYPKGIFYMTCKCKLTPMLVTSVHV